MLSRIIISLHYAPTGRYINALMHSLIKSVNPEMVNRYDLWVLRYKIRGAKQICVTNIQWNDQIPIVYISNISLTLYIINNLKNKGALFHLNLQRRNQSFSLFRFVLSILQTAVKEVTNAHTR